MPLSDLHGFAIALIIGLLIGIERERHHPEGSQAIGVRTFALLALLGTFSAVIDNPMLTVTLSAFVVMAVLVGYVSAAVRQQPLKKIGLTTEVSAAIVFCLGYMTPERPLLAVVLAGIVLLVLIERQRIHTFSRTILTRQELESAVVLLLFILGVVPFLPHQPIDPWGLINLHLLGRLMALIAAIQFGGYIMVRLFGKNLGVMLMGFFGGLVSSTAVFLNMPQLLKRDPKLVRPAVSACLLAVNAKLLELIGILILASLTLFYGLAAPIFAMMGVSLILVPVLMYQQPHQSGFQSIKNPLDVRSVLWLTLFIGGVLAFVALLRQYVGSQGVQMVAFLGALFELHGSSLAVILLYQGGQLSLVEASQTLAVAVLGSFTSKFVILAALSRNGFGLITSMSLALMLATGALVLAVQRSGVVF